MTAPMNDEVRHLTPRRPDIDAIDPAEIVVRYEDFTDTMFLYLKSRDIVPVSVLINPDRDVYALVDPETEEVIGLQMEGFLQHLSAFINEDPVMFVLAIYGDVPIRKLLPILEQAGHDQREAQPTQSHRRTLSSSIVLNRLDEFFNQRGGPSTPALA